MLVLGLMVVCIEEIPQIVLKNEHSKKKLIFVFFLAFALVFPLISAFQFDNGYHLNTTQSNSSMTFSGCSIIVSQYTNSPFAITLFNATYVDPSLIAQYTLPNLINWTTNNTNIDCSSFATVYGTPNQAGGGAGTVNNNGGISYSSSNNNLSFYNFSIFFNNFTSSNYNYIDVIPYDINNTFLQVDNLTVVLSNVEYNYDLLLKTDRYQFKILVLNPENVTLIPGKVSFYYNGTFYSREIDIPMINDGKFNKISFYWDKFLNYLQENVLMVSSIFLIIFVIIILGIILSRDKRS